MTGPQDLAGLRAAAQCGTTNADFLEDASEALAARGDEPIDVRLFPTDPDAVEALRNNPLPVGLAIRKQDADLRVAAERAIDGMYRDGTMKAILSRWAMSDFALERPPG